MTDGLPAQTPMTPGDDPSWAHYTNTMLEMLADRSLVVDLRSRVPPDALAVLAAHGLGPTFAMLTACNPRGVTLDDDANRQLDGELRRDITAMDRPWVPADGVSLDRSHREPGVAASMSKGDARGLARRYEQSAIFWFDGATMWIVGALVDTPDIELPAD